MKKIIIFLCFCVCFSSLLVAAPVHYNYKKEAVKGNSQIDFSKIDMKNISEVKMTFVGMEFNSQGWADFVPLDKTVNLTASNSIDLRFRYKNRPSYEYDTKINKKDIHFKAKNYFYLSSYLQIKLVPDKKNGTKLRCNFNGIENKLSSYIVEKAAIKENSRTFKYLKRLGNKAESLDFSLAKDLKEIPAKLSYCKSNLVFCKYNMHFGSAKPLFGKGNPNEVKDVTITFFAALHSIKTSDGNIIKYKTNPRPKYAQATKSTNKKSVSKKKTAQTAQKTITKPATGTNNKTTTGTNKVAADAKVNSEANINSELAPRSDDELNDDLGAEVIFASGPENSLKDERSIAPRTDNELDSDLGGE